jgi:hypothetical protein
VLLIGRVIGYKDDKYLNLRMSEETKGGQVEYHWMKRVREDKKIFRALRCYPSPMSIKDHVVLGPVKQALIMYWRMQDLWSPVNLVASVTAWSNHNCYSLVVVGGRIR